MLSMFCTLRDYSNIRQFDTYVPNRFSYEKPKTLEQLDEMYSACKFPNLYIRKKSFPNYLT